MSQEWKVKSVVKSGDRVHVELQEQDHRPVGLFSAVAAIIVVAVIAWSFYAAGVVDPAKERARVWTAATDQLLECGDAQGNSVTFYWSDSGTWQVAQRQARGRTEYYPVVVEDRADSVHAVGSGVTFVYKSQAQQVQSNLGTWSDCRVRRAG